MAAAWSLVVGAPVAAFVLLCYALRPADAGRSTAPVRLAVVRAALAVGAYAVLVVEVASGRGALTRPVVGSAWLAGVGLAAALAATRYNWRSLRSRGAPAPQAPPSFGARLAPLAARPSPGGARRCASYGR